jgi:CBS-domain-containing membrane protein
MGTEFRTHWKYYTLQSLLATVSIGLVLFFLTLENAVVVASIGASTFIVFAMPKSITSEPRNLIGGHMIGLINGSLFALIPHSTPVLSIIVYALAVGVSIFIMVVVDMEHPPASGTTLGVAIAGFSWSVAIALITAVIVLTLIHRLFKSRIRDLV